MKYVNEIIIKIKIKIIKKAQVTQGLHANQ
jgi:hypothetical protein